MEDNTLKNELNMRSFLIKKYWFELTTLIIMLSFIFIMRYFTFFTTEVTGTLSGVVLGYFGASVRKIHE